MHLEEDKKGGEKTLGKTSHKIEGEYDCLK